MEKLLGSKKECALLEPLMSLEVEVPTKFVGDTLSDLTVTRRAHIHDISSGNGDGNDNGNGNESSNSSGTDMSTITASVPLGTMLGYATNIRSLTQGEGNFSMEFLEYSAPLDENIVREILD